MKEAIMAVYMATHIQQDKVPYDYIIPIQVGSMLTGEKLYDVYDYSEEDSISHKNKQYSELTALYWMWKNNQNKYLGMCHYRRFFKISKQECLDILKTNKVIVPKRGYLGRTMKKQYLKNHPQAIWEAMESVLRDKYENTYYATAQKVFNDNIMYPCNMFIGSRAFLNEYCEWLFDILFEIEKKIETSELDAYQLRYAGFIAERLFTLYILYNNIERYECKLINEDENIISPTFFRHVRNSVYYKILGG